MKYNIRFFTKYAILNVFLLGLLYTNSLAVLTADPRLSIENMFTDNLNLTPDAESDYITTVSPEINFSMTEQHGTLSLSYVPSYASYLRFPEYNTLGHAAFADFSGQISRTTRLEFGETYLYTEDPLYDAEEFDYEMDTTIRQGREPYSISTTTLGVTNQFGPENSVALEYEYHFLNNRDSTIEDNYHHSPTTTLNYWIVPGLYGTESEIFYIRRNFDESEDYNDTGGRFRLIRRMGPHFDIFAEYNHELTDYVNQGEDYQTYSPMIGFVWNEYRLSSLSASLGYFFRNNDNTDDDSGPMGTIEAAYSWHQGASVSLSGAAGYDHASSGTENLGFNPYYSVSGRASYPLSQRLFMNIFVDYRKNTYTDEDPDREDSLSGTGAGLSYQALPWLILEANYTFRNLDSNVDINDYVENRAMIAVTFNPSTSVLLLR
jgi:hypothetical protein